MIDVRIGDSRKLIKELPDKSIDCVCTSPPYWGLRDYGHTDQIGLEKTPEEYLTKMLDFFDDVKLKVKDAGNVFVNLGDSYARNSEGGTRSDKEKETSLLGAAKSQLRVGKLNNIKPKSLCMIPQRFAWGMINSNWKLRDDITPDEKQYAISELIKRGLL